MLGNRHNHRFSLIAAFLALTPAPVAAIAGVDAQMTAAIPAQPGEIAKASAADSIALLESGLDALSARDISKARTIRDGLARNSLDGRLLAWAIALRGGDVVTSTETAAAAKALPDWPGQNLLRHSYEKALYREAPGAKTIVKAFGMPPQTIEGAIILARSQLALGNSDAARAALPLWRTQKFDAGDEVSIIKEFGGLIPTADHRFRMERMLHADRVKSAKRVAAFAGAEKLAEAWGAVIRGDKDAGRLLEAVPPMQRSAGYYFAKARYLRRMGKITQAATQMLKAPQEKAAPVDPDAWWTERRALSRELADEGDMKTAYLVAAAYAAESPASAADTEFHAGWYALRGLKDAKKAALHFARIASIAEGSISRARANYWLGRAAEMGGPGKAYDYFDKAARYGSSFYGQLAAARLGREALKIDYPEPTAADRQAFEHREGIMAIRRLEQAGQGGLAEIFYRDLAARLDNPRELALLAAMAEARGNHFLALRVGKIAASRGIEVGALAHPLGAIPSSANISGSGKALAYAVARQESEFNAAAVSGAGARGLLQLLPGTARDMARKAGMSYSKARLTNDAGYNATLGAAFLGEQLGRFDGSYVLTFAGYNAGPRRAADWISRYGDPRGKDIDTVIDWIERIPFTETRSYIQRVMENYQVYKMRLSGKFNIVDDLVNGR